MLTTNQVTTTLEFLNKKHVTIDQGLDFLNFYQGNRGKTPGTTSEQLGKK